MATVRVIIHKITIEPHNNADSLELAVIGGYLSVVKKGAFKTGDLAVYIPEQTVLPNWLLAHMGFWDYEKGNGKLAGKLGNRLKPQKLRGVLSQGLVLELLNKESKHFLTYLNSNGTMDSLEVKEGDDVTDILGIVKWEPEIPIHMMGEVWNAYGRTVKYDIENIKNYMDLINPEEIVSISEKIHGTWCCMGFADGEYVVTSKGLSEKGLAFKLNEANENNLYVRQFLKFGGKEIVDALLKLTEFTTVYVLGEIFGNGVQDLSYGQPTQSFRMFDIYGRKTNDSGVTDGGYFTTARLISTVADLATLGVNVELVPILYQGPFSFKVVDEYTNGKETVSGKESHIREGVVIKVMSERTNHIIHRTILKSVSEAYLTRKGNTTEYN